jgi:hypothetical protein
MTGTQFFTPPTLHQPFGYSHAVSARPGRVVWTAGQVAMRPDGSTAPAGDWEGQNGTCDAERRPAGIGRARRATARSRPHDAGSTAMGPERLRQALVVQRRAIAQAFEVELCRISAL